MFTRFKTLFTLLACYTLPILGLCIFASGKIASSQGLFVLGAGILMTIAGSIYLHFFLERPVEHPLFAVESPVETESEEPFELPQNDHTECIKALQDCEQQLTIALENQRITEENFQQKQHDIDNAKQETDLLIAEFDHYKEMVSQRLAAAEGILREHQQTIKEQRETIEEKQQQILQLEGKTRDLNYEIKALLESSDNSSHSTIVRFPHEYHPVTSEVGNYVSEKPISTPEEASKQLRRCLDIAQKITGASYYNGRSSRLRDIPIFNNALDMRSLFDSLRSENFAPIIVYSQKENKLLFVNNMIKNVLGWNTDKFEQNFHQLFVDGGEAWKQALSSLSFKNETQTTVTMEAKSGEGVSLKCQLGLIPTGSFRHHVIGILYT